MIRIDVEFDPVSGKWLLMVESLAGRSPAGNRLSRKDALPVDAFAFETESEAQSAARSLQQYVTESVRYGAKRTSRRAEREFQEYIKAMK